MAAEAEDITPLAPACICASCVSRAMLAEQTTSFQVTTLWARDRPVGEQWVVMIALNGSVRVVTHGGEEEGALYEAISELRGMGVLR